MIQVYHSYIHSMKRLQSVLNSRRLVILACSLIALPLHQVEANTGLTMFRGSPNRSFYGTGPLPTSAPKNLWRYPDKPMCGNSCVAKECKQWCGTGWTGQPVVWERPDGITEVIFGAYDKQVHFVDAKTGKATRAPYPTGDIIKGSVSLDPDGFPLLYFGSRDNHYRVLALDREPVREVFILDAYKVSKRYWNDDWDSNGFVHEDRLFVGGENAWFYIVKLNRTRDLAGFVQIKPEIEVQMPGWTEEMMRKLHPQMKNTMISIESSPVLYKNRVYWTNSGGMVVGIDWTKVKDKKAEIVFSFWTGDDTDATPVVDADGNLYVAVQYELDNGRAARASAERVKEVGQLIKLNPYDTTGNPILWSVPIPPRGGDGKGGVWSTPALDTKRGQVIVTTHTGDLLAVDQMTGKEVFRKTLGHHEWSSPVIIDDHLLVGRCAKGGFEMFNLTQREKPDLLWSHSKPSACVESTPAVWRGRIYVGSRDGYFYAFGD